ncbi:MAG TPA: hypothetical protein VGB13_10950 [Candidatus Krumholzibacteria bacterium]
MSDPDPLLTLLRELRDQGIERDKREEQRSTEHKQSEIDRKSFQGRMEAALRELRSDLVRQDQQMSSLALRISGNYTGIAERLDMVDQDLRQMFGLMGNVEIAVVELSKSSRMLHGRMIEESSVTRAQVTLTEAALAELDHRVDAVEHSARALEKRLADQEPPSVESVEAASGG